MKRAQRIGLTLPELMMTMALGTMVLGIAYPVLDGTVRYMLQAEADVQTQSQGLLMSEKLLADFAFSARSSLVVTQNPPAASFLSQDECHYPVPPLPASHYTASSSTSDPVVWRKFVALRYNPDSYTLDRIEYPYSGGSFLAAQTQRQLQTTLALPAYAASTRTIATGVERFKMFANSSGSLYIEFFNTRKARKEQSSRVSCVLTMRN